MNTLDALDAQSQRTDIPDFRAGDTLKVHARVVEATAPVSRSSRVSSSGATVPACARPSPSGR